MIILFDSKDLTTFSHDSISGEYLISKPKLISSPQVDVMLYAPKGEALSDDSLTKEGEFQSGELAYNLTQSEFMGHYHSGYSNALSNNVFTYGTNSCNLYIHPVVQKMENGSLVNYFGRGVLIHWFTSDNESVSDAGPFKIVRNGLYGLSMSIYSPLAGTGTDGDIVDTFDRSMVIAF